MWLPFPLTAWALLQATCLCALLQPAPEVYDLFDDVMLLCDGAPWAHLSCTPASCTQSGPHTRALQGTLCTTGPHRTACPSSTLRQVFFCMLACACVLCPLRHPCTCLFACRAQIVQLSWSSHVQGYKLPERKGTADFLQEVTSKKACQLLPCLLLLLS